MKIVHANLAKGFRGGERQTALLIDALSSYGNLQQTLVCRKDSPLRQTLSDVPGLGFALANHQLAAHAAVGPVDIVHAHEAKAVHWACWHRLTRRVPYLLTRRVDTPVGDKLSNRWCYRLAARRVAISRPIQHQLRRRGWGDVELIPSTLAQLRHDPAATRDFCADFAGKFLIGHVGALVDRHKGQRVLLEAARLLEQQIPDMHFVFLGDGEDAESLRRESSGLRNVSWLGFKENIGNYIAGLDVFAFPSRHEGLGSVLLDVMDLGIPVIASDVGGIPDIVKDDVTGLLVPGGNAQTLADALTCLYETPALGRRLAAAAGAQLERYRPQAMAAAYLALYQDISVRGKE